MLLQDQARARLELMRRELREQFAAPGGFLPFIRHFWRVLEPDVDFQSGWALEAMALHLEAVAFGRINRLLMNVCPGSMKSLMCNVFFPAWVWGALKRPGARFFNLSYSASLPERDNRKTIRLINSPEYKRLYPEVVLEKAGEELLETSRTGSKQAAGIGGTVTGRRADFLILDDPNNVSDIESEAIRETAMRVFREAASNRLNDMIKSAIIVIQQRTHEDDVSGVILTDELPYCHLYIPLLSEEGRRCETELGWIDPREEPDECYWPERYPDEAIRMAMDQGPFVFAGQYQQRPEPRGGGILKREYWRHWSPAPDPVTKRRNFPVCDFVLASLDPAFTAKEENDPAGFTVWGTFLTDEGDRAVCLLYAWRKRLELCGPDQMRWPGETDEDYRERCSPQWGLVETVHDACARYRADVLLVENKASGHSVVQAMARLFPRHKYTIELHDPMKLDKMARVIRVQPEFSGGYVWAPLDRSWASMVVDECAMFPRGRYDDLTDSVTQAVYWLRKCGFLERRQEQFMAKEDAAQHRKRPAAIYPI